RPRLNGIFAFAIWDEVGQCLFMARDRLGVKPLFYCQRKNSLLFGSEIKALLAHPEVQPAVDGQGLAEVLIMGPSRTPGQGIFKGISELRPGCCLLFDQNGLRINKYWALQSRPHEDDLETTANKLRGLFEDTVRRQLIADVPVATLLSGGLDSSAITACAARVFKEEGRSPVHTYSVEYRDNEKYFVANKFQPDADDPWIKRVSNYVGSEHTAITIDNHDLAKALERTMRANDYPGMADIDASLYLFCQEIKKETTVGLSGECADEVLGGYPWFSDEESLNCGTFPWLRMIQTKFQFLSPEIIQQIKPEQYVNDRYHEALQEVPGLPGEDITEAKRRQMFYLNITRFMPTLLDRKDRMSMACGLEIRVPFADHRLVEYVWNIPWQMKSVDGMSKGIMRRALKGILPDDVLTRRKSPYPKTHSPIYAEVLRQQLLEILYNKTSPLLNVIDSQRLGQVIASGGQIFNVPWFGQLMGDAQYMAYLIQLDTWLKNYRVKIC
ncbi:MAG: asparagine synthase (glutamine-hydrolyzing), partial [Ignavibacteriales bacterium]